MVVPILVFDMIRRSRETPLYGTGCCHPHGDAPCVYRCPVCGLWWVHHPDKSGFAWNCVSWWEMRRFKRKWGLK